MKNAVGFTEILFFFLFFLILQIRRFDDIFNILDVSRRYLYFVICSVIRIYSGLVIYVRDYS